MEDLINPDGSFIVERKGKKQPRMSAPNLTQDLRNHAVFILLILALEASLEAQNSCASVFVPAFRKSRREQHCQLAAVYPFLLLTLGVAFLQILRTAQSYYLGFALMAFLEGVADQWVILV